MDFSKISGGKKASKYESLIRAFGRTEAARKTTKNKDTNIWYPVRDTEGNATATIRFLPGLESEDEPCYIEKFSHGFKGKTNQWLFEECPTTIEQPCPVCEANGQVVSDAGGNWELMTEAQRADPRRRKRKQAYVANILVISDTATPDNDGKVFKFQFGKKIMDKIVAKFQPKFADVEPINIFDLTEGANFRLSICKVDGYANYDESEFDVISPVDPKIVKTLQDTQFSLFDIISEDKYNSYEDIEKRLNKVENFTSSKSSAPKGENVPEPSTSSLLPESESTEEPDMGEEMSEGENDYFANLAADVG